MENKRNKNYVLRMKQTAYDKLRSVANSENLKMSDIIRRGLKMYYLESEVQRNESAA